MHSQDAPEFFKLLDATYELTGRGQKVLSAAARAMFFQDLQEYPWEWVQKAFEAHRKDAERSKFGPPNPGDIRHQIEIRMPVQWIGANEAWALMPKDEQTSAVLNQVTAKALAAAARIIATEGETAARMAFRDAYERGVATEKLAGRKPEYFFSASQGGSEEEKLGVMQEGVRLGLLPTTVLPVVQQLEHAPPSAAARAALLAYKPKIISSRDQEEQ